MTFFELLEELMNKSLWYLLSCYAISFFPHKILIATSTLAEFVSFLSELLDANSTSPCILLPFPISWTFLKKWKINTDRKEHN